MPISVLVKCFWKAALEEKLFPLKDSDSSVYVCVCVSEAMGGGGWGERSAFNDYQAFFFYFHDGKCGITNSRAEVTMVPGVVNLHF